MFWRKSMCRPFHLLTGGDATVESDDEWDHEEELDKFTLGRFEKRSLHCPKTTIYRKYCHYGKNNFNL
jgi:hypothetical protein